MKKLFVVLALQVFAFTAQAQYFFPTSNQIPKNTEVVDVLKDAKVVTTSLCPQGVQCITNGTVVALTFSLPCMSKLGPVSYQALQSSDGIELFVSAIVYLNHASLYGQCSGTEQAVERISLVNAYGPVHVHFLSQNMHYGPMTNVAE